MSNSLKERLVQIYLTNNPLWISRGLELITRSIPSKRMHRILGFVIRLRQILVLPYEAMIRRQVRKICEDYRHY